MLSSVLLAVVALMLTSLFRAQALKMPRYATAVLASARGVSVQRSGSALYASTAASVAASWTRPLVESVRARGRGEVEVEMVFVGPAFASFFHVY